MEPFALRTYLTAKKSVNWQIFWVLLNVGFLTLLVKVVSFAKELAIAHQFGISPRLDAFLIAFALPSFVVNVVAGSFLAALVPTYVQTQTQDGAAAAGRLFASVQWVALGLLVGAALLMALAAPLVLPLMGSGFDAEQHALARTLFYIMLPSVVLSGLGTIYTAVLNAGERFALAALSPMFIPFAIMLGLALATPDQDAHALAWGTVAGYGVQTGVLGWSLHRQKLPILPRWYGASAPLRQVAGQYLPMAAGALLLSSAPLIDQAMASSLGGGKVAALNYGNRLVTVLLSVGSMALSTAVLPYFSKQVALEDWRGIRHTLARYTQLILGATLPLTLVVVVFSKPIIALTLERGAFTADDTQTVSEIQVYYMLQVPFLLLGILYVRLISSMKRNQILMWMSGVSLVNNVALNYLFMRWLGVAGIALSTALVYAVSAGVFGGILYRRLRSVD